MAIRLGTVWMMIVLVSRAATAGAGPVPTLEACIQDAPPASYRAMLSATLMASQIYAEAGIMLRWANRCLPHMLVVIMLTIDGDPMPDAATVQKKMEAIASAKPASVVLKVKRGIRTFFVELQTGWK